MLTRLFVKDFAIVDHLDIEIDAGMTTITGETGAGKSISIDAIGLCLGHRAEAGMVKTGADKSEISATFNIQQIPSAQHWLLENDLLENDQDECIIRRVITKEGRSRAYINGAPVPAQQLKALAPLLLHIHGQHAHHLLLKNDYQMAVLDQFAGHKHLLAQTQLTFQGWNKLKQELKALQLAQSQRDARSQLLAYQVAELDDFALQEGEFSQIENEHKKLSNAVGLLQDSQQCFDMLYQNDEQNLLALLKQVQQKLLDASRFDDSLTNITQMLGDAEIQLTEASYELRDYIEGQEPDPERLAEIEQRMSMAMDLSRKHKVSPEELPQEHLKLAAELAQIKQNNEQTSVLEESVKTAAENYWKAAEALSKSRQKAAQRLAKEVTQSMQQLNMQQGQFAIRIERLDKACKLGSDLVEFEVCANPGQPMQALNKVASGGELSRISLAIQVLTSSQNDTATLIFDEVDVGISGPTAAVVGKMLRKIGQHTQVMCVTHLPQVAACGHQQMQVSKTLTKQKTQTTMFKLSAEERITELARLLGGDQITQNTLQNARELLVS